MDEEDKQKALWKQEKLKEIETRLVNNKQTNKIANSPLSIPCSTIQSIIDRINVLEGDDDVTEDELAQFILHTSTCEDCAEYLYETFNKIH